MPIDPKRIIRWLAGALAVASLFAGTSARAQDDLERAIMAGSWAFFWSEGEAGSRAAYFFHMGSVRSELTGEGQQLVSTLGNRSLPSEAAYKLLEQQYQVIRVVRISEAAGEPQWTDMTLNVNCPLGQIRLAETTKSYAGKPVETSQPTAWFNVPMSWAYRATSLACQQKQWRDAWNFTAKHWICARFRSTEEGGISKQCNDAITRSIAGYLCDQERATKAGIVCASLGSDIETVHRKATEVILPMLNGTYVAEPMGYKPFVGERPVLPEDQ